MRILIFSLLLVTSSLSAAANPFLSSDADTPKDEKKTSVTLPTFPAFNSQFRRIVEAQRFLYVKLSTGIRSIKEGDNPGAYVLLAFFVLLYGILHAIGPGHGKIFIVSYFLSRRAPLLKGFFFSFTVAFLHAGISTAAVLVLYSVIEKGLMLTLENTQHVMMLLSYGLITLIGLYLLIFAIRNRHSNNHDEEFNGRHFFSMALSIAMTPCPATILVLLFSLTNGMVFPGLFAVFFLAVGMGLSLGLVALATIGTSASSVCLLERFTGSGMRIARALSIAGPVFIIILGLLFLLAGISSSYMF